MTDSDDSEDERMKLVLEAVDTGFLDNKLFAAVSENDETEARPAPVLKSQRHLSVEDEKHSTDLQIPESMQKFIGKKLSEIIAKSYAFVDAVHLQGQPIKAKKKLHKSCVTLLKDYDSPILQTDVNSEPQPKLRPKRAKIQGRTLELDTLSESEKLRLAAVDFQVLDAGEEVKHWAERQCKDKVFRYKRGKGGILHFVEPKNEFYELRKKNCWSEKYIRGRLKKNETIKK